MANGRQTLICWTWAVLLALVQSSLATPQTGALHQRTHDIAADAQGTVTVACSSPGTALRCDTATREVQVSAVQQATPDSALEDFARQVLGDAAASGFIHVRDVNSGRMLTHVSAPDLGTDPTFTSDSPVPPLSVIKVYMAASWLEHGLGGTFVDCAPTARPLRHMLIEDVLVSGCDSAGGEVASILKRKFGAARILRDLHRFGIRDLTLAPDAPEDAWRRTLSLGEDHIFITPRQLSAFLRAIGQGGAKLLSRATAARLKAALEAVVCEPVERSTPHPLRHSCLYSRQRPWRRSLRPHGRIDR